MNRGKGEGSVTVLKKKKRDFAENMISLPLNMERRREKGEARPHRVLEIKGKGPAAPGPDKSLSKVRLRQPEGLMPDFLNVSRRGEKKGER